MVSRFEKEQEENPSTLKALMTAAPTPAHVHAAIMRKKVHARRLAEDAIEHARQRRDPLSDL